MNGQIETLMLLAENKRHSFFTILNQFHHLINAKLLKNLICRVSRSKFGSDALEQIIKSQSFRSIFYEKVNNSGLR